MKQINSITIFIPDNSLGRINQKAGYPGFDKNITPRKWIDGPGEGSIVEQ